MRKRRGAALPGAIIICAMLLIVSYAVGASIMQLVANNVIYNYKTNQNLIYETSYKEFLVRFEVSDITDTTYTWKKFQGEKDATDYVALVAYHSLNGNMVFYTIHNVDEDRTVAYQTTNFYLSSTSEDTTFWGLALEE